MNEEYVCQCDVCTGNIDNCVKCMKAMGASELKYGLCQDCIDKMEDDITREPTQKDIDEFNAGDKDLSESDKRMLKAMDPLRLIKGNRKTCRINPSCRHWKNGKCYNWENCPEFE